jgi:hypothetical protein
MRGLESLKGYAIVFAFLGVWGLSCQELSSASASQKNDGETDSGDAVHTSEENDTGDNERSGGEWPYECSNSPEALHDYRYPEPASGLECSIEAPCGEGSVCSDVWFPQTQGYTGAQCYPACKMEGANTPCCETGDVCAVLKEGVFACLALGSAQKESLKLKILPKGAKVDHDDVAYVGAKVSVDGKIIPINMSYIIEEELDFNSDGQVEDVVIVELEGVAGIAGTWVFQITVPKERWVAGELVAKRGEEADRDFDAVLTKWVGQRMTVKAVLQDGIVRIEHPGTACKTAPCDKATLGFDIGLVAIEATR